MTTLSDLRGFVSQFSGNTSAVDAAESELVDAVVAKRTGANGRVDYEGALHDLQRMHAAWTRRASGAQIDNSTMRAMTEAIRAELPERAGFGLRAQTPRMGAVRNLRPPSESAIANVNEGMRAAIAAGSAQGVRDILTGLAEWGPSDQREFAKALAKSLPDAAVGLAQAFATLETRPSDVVELAKISETIVRDSHRDISPIRNVRSPTDGSIAKVTDRMGRAIDADDAESVFGILKSLAEWGPADQSRFAASFRDALPKAADALSQAFAVLETRPPDVVALGLAVQALLAPR
jgi:hypothetical protein